MKKKNIIVFLTVGVILIAFIAVTVLFKLGIGENSAETMGGSACNVTTESSKPDKDASVNPSLDDNHAYFIIRLKYPFETYDEGLELSNEQLDENIADLEKQYEAYLKTCKSEELKALAQERYQKAMDQLSSVKQIKARTPEEQKRIHEIAFYESYNNILKECSDPEKYGFRPEDAVRRKDTAERAKKYYEEGVITIEQACQAIELGSPSLPYDPTFSLPD